MKQKIIDSLRKRVQDEIAPQSPLRFLKTLDVRDYFDTVVSTVYLYTRSKRGIQKNTFYMAEMISAIGHGIRNKYKLKRDSAIAAKAGAFILYTFESLGIVRVVLGQGGNKHASYIVQVLDDDSISQLWSVLDPAKTEKLPSEKPYAPWTSTRHETGAILIKTGNKHVLSSVTPETHPIVFSNVNKAQCVGWNVNRKIFDLHLWALRNKADAFAEIWEMQNPEAKTTKLREARAIGGIAKRFLYKTFYHLYYYDFRGRKYPATAYFHEQGPDLARGMLLREDCKPMGKQGFFWLMVSIASNWAGSSGRDDGRKTDKIPLEDRYHWALDNEEILLNYAEFPKVSQGWMKADKPWQFLAACMELRELRMYQAEKGDFEDFEFESHLEVYIDGSNNGSQHLSALTKDEVTAPHVNLVPQDLPGDLYKYVGDHVWAHLEDMVKDMPAQEREECERLIDNLIEFKKQISLAEPKSDLRKELVASIKSFKDKNKDLLDKSSAIYWLRITDPKHVRKLVKRNVMTLPYGGTSYGLG